MYNGIGLRTVRGSGTNGYVQRNLSYVNASRTRQTLARNQRGGGSDFGARGGGRNRPPPNADILLHEQKRKVELQLLEMSLEMEDRGCDPEEIQDKVKRERERLVARLNGDGDKGGEKRKDVESSHARQKRKEQENARLKSAFGIATDYVAGESFDPEMQEKRRQERVAKREQEYKEREEARQQRQKEREEREEAMKARRERFRSPHSRSRSRARRRSRSPAERRGRERRSGGREDGSARRKSRSRSDSRSPSKGRRSRWNSLPSSDKKRRSVSSSSGSSRSRSSSASSRSRSRTRKSRADNQNEKKKQSKSRSRSSSSSGCDRSQGKSKVIARVKEVKMSVSVSPARPAVHKGERKILNLSANLTSGSAVASEESLSPRSDAAPKGSEKENKAADVMKGDSKASVSEVKKEIKREPSPQKEEKKKRRFPRARRCLTRMSVGLPTSGAARGLTVIMALLLVGIVGFVALHQMMSPEIEALTQQRERLKDDVMALRLQVENMTRIAESRLETIHLLETELERQHVEAAEAAATATTDTKPGVKPAVANEPAKGGDLRPSVVLPNFFYTFVLGCVLLSTVLYRIFLIIRSEMDTQQKLGKKTYMGSDAAGGLMSMPSVSEDGKRSGRGTPPLSPTRGPIIDDSVSSGGTNGNTALSPTANSESSPQCYKRAPGSSPTIV
ncbi:Serine/arginine repetitive matrix protein 2 [Phytophthora boehmeriae]|uniref:Serine/arginine repetitive matrix protein 2 n=1 Tax=Phytophthora boehmeriae TaxID=109152 RepID=A0A8T1WMS7_9STRA|nr:Serine/arginine repetitive matrix protein 2 [Phytophthora boehmeriae]